MVLERPYPYDTRGVDDMSTNGVYTNLKGELFKIVQDEQFNYPYVMSISDAQEDFKMDVFRAFVPSDDPTHWFWEEHILMIPEELMR